MTEIPCCSIFSLNDDFYLIFLSDRQVGATLKYKLIGLYQDFQKQIFNECKFNPRLGNSPVDLEGIYGELDEPYTIFMTPGAVLT